MIRVNLLGGERPIRRTSRLGVRNPARLGLAAVTVAALASVGDWWWLRTAERQLDRALAVAEVEAGRLRESARQADQINARKGELTARLASIARDEAARFVPVRLLAAVGEQVPDGVWLTAAEQHGTRLEIAGRARSMTAVTDFVDQIRGSGAVNAPVEILSASAETRDRTTVVRFSVRLN
ncbi:MAG: PilN domain-containing protein [Acidobacteriota bacterium]